MNGPRPWRHRAALAAAALAVAAWVAGAPYLARLDEPALVFRPLPGLEPFRELAVGGAISTGAGSPLLTGLPSDDPPQGSALMDEVRANPCRAFHGGYAGEAVPVAVFSDIRCPNCRIMDARLAEVAAANPAAIRIVRHELPVLGAGSVIAARALLAAESQGARQRLHDRLVRTPAVTDAAYVARVAEAIGLDAARLLKDMQSDAVTADLRRSRAIADLFGFSGTPAFAIGGTVLLGTAPISVLEALIAEERHGACSVRAPG
ncbi:hypothetical protein OCGS_1399 [Oceaniovalibus guishaninsula JLT2003]|uniref:DSBA-like thioredoxin domain-containing protein n=1 Tax=Oceaniovalibus guishaninsula JLT2003 TaxID=1231392 RepID=K2GPH4_9RHOB|nr:DsbA family protein [Oceaniovalibus guishaninsula]EKE44561.1 hypothetical protein OCGS_1399 [Oceaniovalibus guishaninsula JLT2003]